MSKLSLTEAVRVIPVSESTLRRDLKRGNVSFDTDAKGRKQIDVSELTRVYGQLKPSNGTPPAEEPAEPVNDTHPNPSLNGNDTPNVVAFLENQIADLKAQLAQANARETRLHTEKSQLLDLTDRLQKQNEVLMLPPPPRPTGWLSRLKNVFRPHRKETETA